MTWPVGQARYFSRVKVRDRLGEHVGDDFAEVAAPEVPSYTVGYREDENWGKEPFPPVSV